MNHGWVCVQSLLSQQRSRANLEPVLMLMLGALYQSCRDEQPFEGPEKSCISHKKLGDVHHVFQACLGAPFRMQQCMYVSLLSQIGQCRLQCTAVLVQSVT